MFVSPPSVTYGVLFCPFHGILCLYKAFQFHEVLYINFLSKCLSYWCSIQDVVSCANPFKAIYYFLFYCTLCVWFYLEVFHILGKKFVKGPEIALSLISSGTTEV